MYFCKLQIMYNFFHVTPTKFDMLTAVNDFALKSSRVVQTKPHSGRMKSIRTEWNPFDRNESADIVLILSEINA